MLLLLITLFFCLSPSAEEFDMLSSESKYSDLLRDELESSSFSSNISLTFLLFERDKNEFALNLLGLGTSVLAGEFASSWTYVC